MAAEAAWKRYADQPSSWMRDMYERQLNALLAQTPMQHERRYHGDRDWGWWDRYARWVTFGVEEHYSRGYGRVDLIDTADGPRYVWQTQRHWLGESLIEARVPAGTRRVTCTRCHGTGWDRVSIGREPKPWARTHETRYEGRCFACNDGRTVKKLWRTAKFLSGFDHNERRESYFFCELPPCDATTVEQAYEALKPEAVRIAERVGRGVVRQGDIFGVAAPTMTNAVLRAAGASIIKRGNLLGTNHEATATATLPDGSVYARGSLYHAPRDRDPDHARCKLPDGWSLIVKNTVPVTA